MFVGLLKILIDVISTLSPELIGGYNSLIEPQVKVRFRSTKIRYMRHIRIR